MNGRISVGYLPGRKRNDCKRALVQEGTRGDWQPEFSTTEAAAEEKALDSHIDRLGWRDEGWGGEAWEARSTEMGMVHVKCSEEREVEVRARPQV
jgi:hypothetical protein